MFSWFGNIKVGLRVLLGMLVPVIGLVVYAGVSMGEKYGTSQELERVGAIAKLAPTVSALAHEMQKERGQSAGFIASKGSSFADILPGQRKDTNARREDLVNAINAFDFTAYAPSLGNAVDKAVADVAELGRVRGQVSDLKINVAGMAKYYTGTITSLLSIVSEMLIASTDDDVSKEIAAYVAFLQGKERAGRERAMGAGGFGSGKFQPAIYNRFVELIASQDLLFKSFRLFGTDEEWAYYQATMTGKAVDEVARMRKIALASPQTGDMGGITGSYWFAQITDKINLMKRVEDHIAHDLDVIASEKSEAAWHSFLVYLAATLTLLAVTALLVFAIVRSITAPVGALTEVMHKLSEGDKTVDVFGKDRRDEIGAMAQAVEIFKQNAIEMERMEAEQAEQKIRAEEQRKAEMLEMANGFEASVMGVVESVSSSASQMENSAQSMSGTAQQASTQSANVATASQQATANVQTVASAAEELAASVQEISRQVADSSQISNEAVSEADRVGHQMQELAEASQRIGEVVDLINDIAGQTNLLALNATIEAARAGDAGKGFAVVASEVKNLANQTANATGEIAEQIGSIQGATSGAVKAIEDIAGTIRKINDIAATISAAVEQQGSATGEISMNVQQAAKGTQEVDNNISKVSRGADETGVAAGEVLSAAKDLTQQSGSLREEVDKFLQRVRAA
ncbi:MAG: nitrate- and nitrite sensing domain-containing protein [Alphaproteobacteria bacterium]|jgi:methyl-accepting chemotaxis protein|nr:nitrate- and nitrite sensing domain-containing protein [Alphaproteobacteria bacterium]